jgi:hypothetical protein
MFRVLVPGGLAFITTTNRHSPRQFEFNVPLYNFLPAIVKESFVYLHLHFSPKLANYTERPAVHWYSYAQLCRLGRAAGFAQFYSPLDLVEAQDPPLRTSAVKRAVLARVQHNAWLRAIALTFTRFGGTIAMLKRPDSINALSVAAETARVSARVNAISAQAEPSAARIGGNEKGLLAACGRPSHSP